MGQHVQPQSPCTIWHTQHRSGHSAGGRGGGGVGTSTFLSTRHLGHPCLATDAKPKNMWGPMCKYASSWIFLPLAIVAKCAKAYAIDVIFKPQIQKTVKD